MIGGSCEEDSFIIIAAKPSWELKMCNTVFSGSIVFVICGEIPGWPHTAQADRVPTAPDSPTPSGRAWSQTLSVSSAKPLLQHPAHRSLPARVLRQAAQLRLVNLINMTVQTSTSVTSFDNIIHTRLQQMITSSWWSGNVHTTTHMHAICACRSTQIWPRPRPNNPSSTFHSR